jgi:uncharacterized protein YbcI
VGAERTGEGSVPDDPISSAEETLGAPTPEEVEQSTARQLLAIHEDSYGCGATRATSHLVGDTLVVVLDGLELLPNEELMIANGKEEAVRDVRLRFQQAIEQTFRAAVERATGRRVIAFTSNTHLDQPRFAVEIFRLEPER